MSSAWLWYYTRSADAASLRQLNEERAAAFHARHRALRSGAADLISRLRQISAAWRERRLERALAIELDGLSDHLLRDVGWSRNGVLDRTDEMRPATRLHSGETRSERVREASGVSPRAAAVLVRLPASSAPLPPPRATDRTDRESDRVVTSTRGARAA